MAPTKKKASLTKKKVVHKKAAANRKKPDAANTTRTSDTPNKSSGSEILDSDHVVEDEPFKRWSRKKAEELKSNSESTSSGSEKATSSNTRTTRGTRRSYRLVLPAPDEENNDSFSRGADDEDTDGEWMDDADHDDVSAPPKSARGSRGDFSSNGRTPGRRLVPWHRKFPKLLKMSL
jgi:hypothetical protein